MGGVPTGGTLTRDGWAIGRVPRPLEPFTYTSGVMGSYLLPLVLDRRPWWREAETVIKKRERDNRDSERRLRVSSPWSHLLSPTQWAAREWDGILLGFLWSLALPKMRAAPEAFWHVAQSGEGPPLVSLVGTGHTQHVCLHSDNIVWAFKRSRGLAPCGGLFWPPLQHRGGLILAPAVEVGEREGHFVLGQADRLQDQWDGFGLPQVACWGPWLEDSPPQPCSSLRSPLDFKV